MAPYFLRQIVSFYALFPALSLHKFLIYHTVPNARHFFFLLSQFSFADSIRSPPQYFSSSFRIHPDFISRTMISPRAILSLPRFPPRHYFLAVASSVCLLSSPLASCSVFAALQRMSDLTLSSYVSSILYPRHRSPRRPRALLTVRRTLESHKALRRIFHAAISASRRERRYSSRRPIRRKMRRSPPRLNEVGRNFLGLLSNVPMQRDD